MDNSVMFKIGYGLYILSAKENEKINGCIINVVNQVTITPNRVTVAICKENFTHGMITRTKMFNVSILAVSAPFNVFEKFGYQSGIEINKFEGFKYRFSSNGLPYLSEHCNSYLSCKLISITDLDTHSLFLAEVVDGQVLSDEESVTYDYYQKNIKPKPEDAATGNKKGWRCKICNFIYEGDDLPADYVCPICKHGAIDFEKIEPENAGADSKSGWICTICNYIYEGDELPADYVCPVCKHGAIDFEKIDPENTISGGKKTWKCKICKDD